MLSHELCRALDADRQREIERTLVRRRLLEVLAIRPAGTSREDATPADGDARTGASGSRVLGPAR
jgi:hypothetical protein